LLKQVNAVTSHVPGSLAARTVMHNEIRGLNFNRGLPSFYITINPADVYNPLVKFLSGSEINIDNMLPSEVPDYWTQSILVAKNPAIAAKFFNMYLKVFLSVHRSTSRLTMEGGILGVVKVHYGCVEAQGRGTLHCHMLVWLEGGMDPNKIKKRIIDEGDLEFKEHLLAYLDDSISSSIPDDPDPNIQVPSPVHHPCLVCGVSVKSSSSSAFWGTPD
ncbi:hypothetical protein BV22DRAFT_1021443, partial [Leucogyrophana mollusca]